MDYGLVCIIIPTYNRIASLVQSIRSVAKQTYKNTHVIVVNDGSTDQKYYTYDWKKENDGKITVIHMKENSKITKGFPCPGYCRNVGIKSLPPETEYVCFLDDDDAYADTNKIMTQIVEMKDSKVLFSSTNAKHGIGIYHSHVKTKPFHPKKVLPKIFNLKAIEKVNKIITSSTMLHISLIKKAGFFPEIEYVKWKNLPLYEDYEYWKQCLQHSDGVYIDSEMVYYDAKK